MYSCKVGGVPYMSMNHCLSGDSVFGLSNLRAYEEWREKKLDQIPKDLSNHIITISNPPFLKNNEKEKILNLCAVANGAIYSVKRNFKKFDLVALSRELDFGEIDLPIFSEDIGVSVVTNISSGRQKDFIPYTCKPLGWHTDGYYNPLGFEVRSFILHCQSSAESGGQSSFLDPEIVYMHLRDENIEYIEAFMDPNLFSVDANMANGFVVRPKTTSPMFSIINGFLHMRFSNRKKYINWKQGPLVSKARDCLKDILSDDNDFMVHHKFSAGQGLICNNMLHKREAFTDSKTNTRVLYRARFANRITNSKNLRSGAELDG